MDQYLAPPADGHPAALHLINTNRLFLRYEGADGLKTGWTDERGLQFGGHRRAQRRPAHIGGAAHRQRAGAGGADRPADGLRVRQFPLAHGGAARTVRGQRPPCATRPREQVPVRAGVDLRGVRPPQSTRTWCNIRVVAQGGLRAPVDGQRRGRRSRGLHGRAENWRGFRPWPRPTWDGRTFCPDLALDPRRFTGAE